MRSNINANELNFLHPQIEPLSVAVHAVANVADFHANQSVVVFGAGPVGLLCMAVAKALGASRVIAVDIVQNRLDFAKNFAATDIYLPPPMEKDESRLRYSERNAKKLMTDLGIEERGPKGINLVVDASGAEVSIQTGVLVAKIGGTFVQVRSSIPSSLGRDSRSCYAGWHGCPRDCPPDHDHAHEGAQLEGLLPVRPR